MAAHTGGARYLVVDGRRWRKSDPSIPDQLRRELVYGLMDARRAVLAAKRAGKPRAEKAARRRVHDAKLALGERGQPYWNEQSDADRRKRAAATVRALLSRRNQGTSSATICPSDVARTIAGENWRACMPLVREVARELAGRGQIRILQRGREVSIETARGPIRLALKQSAAST